MNKEVSWWYQAHDLRTSSSEGVQTNKTCLYKSEFTTLYYKKSSVPKLGTEKCTYEMSLWKHKVHVLDKLVHKK